MIHRVDGDGGRAQAIQLREGRERGTLGEATEQNSVGRPFVCENLMRPRYELIDQLRRMGSLRLLRLHRPGWTPGGLRIAVGQGCGQSRAANHQQKTVAAFRLHEELRSGYGYVTQLLT